MPAAIGHMAEVPGIDAGDDRVLASIRPKTTNAAVRDDRFPAAAQPPVFRVVVQHALLSPPPCELVGVATEALMRHARGEDPTAKVAWPRLEPDHGRHSRRPALLALGTPLPAIALIAVIRREDGTTRTTLPCHPQITVIPQGGKGSGRGWKGGLSSKKDLDIAGLEQNQPH